MGNELKHNWKMMRQDPQHALYERPEVNTMPATVTTRELFPKADIQKPQVVTEQALRIKAGAITSSIEDDGTNWVLVTVWNVIGEQ
jgi:hypothetical protein